MMKRYILLSTAVIIFGFSGCQFLGIGQIRPEGIAEIAAIVTDYQTQTAYYEDTSGDDNLLEDSASTAAYQTSTISALGLADADVERVLDDNGTPDDPTDDEMTVTRTWMAWNGLSHMEVLVRPLKPTAGPAWAAEWDPVGRIAQNGTLQHYVADMSTPFASVAITAVWQLELDTVYLFSLERVGDRIGRDGVLSKTLVSVDVDGFRTKEVIRYRLVGGNEVVVSRFVYEEWIDPDNGEEYVKVTRFLDDSGQSNGYAIIRSHLDPRIIDFYTTGGQLLKRRTETRNLETRATEVEVIFYDAEGNAISTVSGAIVVRAEGDSVVVTREFDNGRERTVTITDNGDGFTIERNGRIYTVAFQDDGSIVIETDDGTFVVTVNPDGSWTVESPDGSAEVVEV